MPEWLLLVTCDQSICLSRTMTFFDDSELSLEWLY